MNKKKFALILLTFCSLNLCAHEPSDQKLQTLYNSLNPTSLSQHLAFYELYPHKPLGQRALNDAWQILGGKQFSPHFTNHPLAISDSVIRALIALINKQQDQELKILDEKDLNEIDLFAKELSHKKLKGHYALSEEEVFQLAPEEIDLARGLFLSEMGPNYPRIRTYEALLDIMALQIVARLPQNASPEEKIREISFLVFEEMGFRFPPQSVFSQDLDIYSFLPSVLDSHRGVCLGVSILYICLAQRLDLKLEIITPPGHIYVRYRDRNKTINIETTARGIHLDSEHYLSIDTCSLQHRNIKETIGLAHFNHASIFWQQNNYEKAKQAYLRAQPYLKNDCLLKELLGYTYLLTENQIEGEKLLLEIKDHIPDYAITKSDIAEDYFNHQLDIECIKILFSKPEETRSSILTHKDKLEDAVKRFPKFRSGIIQIALSWIKLHRYGEALDTLKYYFALHRDDPEVNYYLAALYGVRCDYAQAWKHLRLAETIVHAQNHYPKALKEFRRELLKECPEF
jgi:hypothetical protein